MKKASKSYNEHILVPKHEKLSDKQKQEFLKKYKCTINELPKINAADIAIKEIGTKPGDIIKIHRTSRTEGESIFYRVVVNE